MNKPKKFFFYALIGSCLFWVMYFVVVFLLNKYSANLAPSIFLIAAPFILFLFFRGDKMQDSILVARAFLFGIWFFGPIYIFLLNPFNPFNQSNHTNFLNLIIFFTPFGVLFMSFMMGVGSTLMICSVFLAYKAIQFNKMPRVFAVLIAILLGVMLFLSVGFFLVSVL